VHRSRDKRGRFRLGHPVRPVQRQRRGRLLSLTLFRQILSE